MFVRNNRRLTFRGFCLVLIGVSFAFIFYSRNAPRAVMSWERSLNYHFKISIENKEGGRITLTNLLSHEGRDEPIEVGRVLRRATSVRSESFRASEHGENLAR